MSSNRSKKGSVSLEPPVIHATSHVDREKKEFHGFLFLIIYGASLGSPRFADKWPYI